MKISTKHAKIVFLVSFFVVLAAMWPISVKARIVTGVNSEPPEFISDLINYGMVNFSLTIHDINLTILFDSSYFSFKASTADVKVYVVTGYTYEDGNRTKTADVAIEIRLSDCVVSSNVVSGNIGFIEVLLTMNVYEDYVEYYIIGQKSIPLYEAVYKVFTGEIRYKQPAPAVRW